MVDRVKGDWEKGGWRKEKWGGRKERGGERREGEGERRKGGEETRERFPLSAPSSLFIQSFFLIYLFVGIKYYMVCCMKTGGGFICVRR